MVDIDELLAGMTLREKAGQMTQLTIDTLCYGEPYAPRDPLELDPEKLNRAVVTYGIGSVLNVGTSAHTPDRWRQLIGAIQVAAQQTRLGIPVLYGIDSIHGANYVAGATLFPHQLALASTRNVDLVEKLFAICAYETRAAGIPWNFAPVCDLGRHPAWPRLWETCGEDVHLTTVMGQAMVAGLEGNDIKHPHRVAACLKHFVGYGYPLSGKDRTPAWIPENMLRELFLPPFTAGIGQGVRSVMLNSSELNGTPVHADAHLLQFILREEMGFEGLAVTDWEDIKYLHTRHRVADSYKEAVRLAILAGVDMSMTPLDTDFTDYIVELVVEGAILESRIDVSVRRILQLKHDLGLFHTTLQPPGQYPAFGGTAHRAQAEQAARESVILLKNEASVLPLSPDQSLLVTGPTANTMRSLQGGWTYTWQGELADAKAGPDEATVLTALRQMWDGPVQYVPGADFEEVHDLAAVTEAGAAADAIVLCLGESSYTEFFGSLDDLYLPRAQEELAEACIATGKPVVLVLLQGRPRLISRFVDRVAAVLTAFYPGPSGGKAMAEVLVGKHNPSGKLPITYPRFPNGIVPYDHRASENLELQGVEGMYNPQFTFGHGLSYTTFKYTALKLSTRKLKPGKPLTVKVDVQNTGDRTGAETVECYVRDHYASITPPVRRLKAFARIELAAGEQQTVTWQLKPRDFSFIDRNNRWRTEPGDFTIYVGSLSVNVTLL